MWSVAVIGVVKRGLCVFLCQAEDGIRDLVRSRGLGDVYKRQVERLFAGLDAMDEGQTDLGIGLGADRVAEQSQQRRRYGVVLVVDLGELVEALRVHREPFEAEAQEDLAGVACQRFELGCCDCLLYTSPEPTRPY